MPAPHVVAVVLNHDHPEDTVACLRSLGRSSYPGLDTIVLDSGHTPDAARAIRSAVPGAEVVELDTNRGYAGNNNVGLAIALRRGADWVLLLNDDVVVDADCVTRLVEAAEADAAIGIVGPTVYDVGAPADVLSAGGVLTRWWSAVPSTVNPDPALRSYRVDWVAGCALLVRDDVCASVGTLDERFFLYWEEVDWCLRAARAGWRIVQAPAARVWHRREPRGSVPAPAITYYVTRNQLLALEKHRAPIGVWLVVVYRLAATLLGWSILPGRRPLCEHRTAMWHGAVDFLAARSGRGRY